MGGMPVSLLRSGFREQLREHTHALCERVGHALDCGADATGRSSGQVLGVAVAPSGLTVNWADWAGQ